MKTEVTIVTHWYSHLKEMFCNYSSETVTTSVTINLDANETKHWTCIH